MEPKRFTVAWDEESYGRLFRRIVVPHAMPRGKLTRLGLAMLSTLGILALAALGAFLVWVFDQIWPLAWAIVGAAAVLILGLLLATQDKSHAIRSHLRVLDKLGPIEYEVADDGLTASYASGVVSRIPWGALRLTAEDEEGLLLLLEDRGQPILLPQSALGEARATILERLATAERPEPGDVRGSQVKRKRKWTRSDWLWIAVGLLPGPSMGFSMAFSPNVCKPNFSDLNFGLLIAFGVSTSLAILWCVKKAVSA